MIVKNNSSIIKSGKLLITFISVIILSFLPQFIFSQQNSKDDNNNNIPDFKILSSTESFIEIEFTPVFKDNYQFSNSVSNSKPGYPDVRFRSFPLYLTGNENNRVEILDSKSEEIFSIDIPPVPELSKSKKKDGVEAKYIKDAKAYSNNAFLPEETAALKFSGKLRNRYMGHLNLYPLHYNPFTQTARKYSYIRVRVTFGSSPVYSTRQLNQEEKLFLDDVAINSDAASNWSTPEFNQSGDSPLTNSVLASGDFYKLEVNQTGIYKLDKSYLQSAGINVSSIDPRTFKIYGYKGSALPYNNSTPVPNDPEELRIYVFGQEDGSFDNGDYILFYGRAPNEWTYDPNHKSYYHYMNIYSASNYYWLSFGNGPGQRMDVVASGNVQGITPLSSFSDRFFEEPEVNNLGSTGTLWLSQKIGVNESYTFNRELKGYVDGSNVNLRFRFGNASFYGSTWRLEDLNSNFVINQYIPYLTNSFSHINLSYINELRDGVFYQLTPGRQSINFKASLPSQNGNSPNVFGYYDFLEVLYDRNFIADNNVLRFNSPDTNAVVEYQISNFSSDLTSANLKVFDVTEHTAVNLISPISVSGGVLRFQSGISVNNPKQYFAIGGNNYKLPVSVSSRVPNQNLKGDLISGSSFIIITPREFTSAANRLKAHREKPGVNYLKTTVIEIDKIYNEFAGGCADPIALRNFFKFAYNNWQERPVYILFLGDGSYDYKNIYNLYNSNIKNWIPPIEKSSDYANEVDSYCSDDYFVEINENHIEPESINIPDLATGRVCVNSLEDANNVVDKIICYEDPANFNKWRNDVTYVADDGWTSENSSGQEGSLHTDQCEDVAQNHTPESIKKQKIYIVSYPSEITPQGRRKPGANADIIKAWNEGKLVINYTGHGSVDLWAHEHIFERQVTIPQLTNKCKYPFLTIASCDLARWDDPLLLSAAEQLVNIKDKGAIGISAAVRPVYSIPNAIYNNKLYDNLFKGDTLNMRIRLGKAVFNVKQELFFDNDIKFALICDPTLRLGVPQYFTKIDSINNMSGDSLFNMKSLQKIKISGSILRPDSSFWSDYSGTIDLKVFDVDKNISMIDFGYIFNYKLLGGIIYSGKANVTNGKWSLNFIVPKDISYNPGRGKIIAYFNNGSSDGKGYSNNFFMSGIDSTAAPDSTGPQISMYLDSRNFRSGDLVNQNPKLIADITDESGINLTGTIGHKIEAVLNNDENNKIDLTEFYSSSSNFQNGSLEYPINSLPDGKHILKLYAWDTYNNFNQQEIEFTVKGNSDIALENVYNYPNPMQDNTDFVFQHNSDSPISADIKIFTVSGRLIKELNKSNITEKFVSINWDGRDTDGDYIANGTYIYKIIIKSEDGSFSKNSMGKLAKLK